MDGVLIFRNISIYEQSFFCRRRRRSILGAALAGVT